MREALVVGGANGIGLAIATLLAEDAKYGKVYIVDRVDVDPNYAHPKFECLNFDLRSEDFSLFDKFKGVDTLMITAGFGRLAHFADVEESHIVDSFSVNTTAVIRIIRHFYDRLLGFAGSQVRSEERTQERREERPEGRSSGRSEGRSEGRPQVRSQERPEKRCQERAQEGLPGRQEGRQKGQERLTRLIVHK